MVKSALITPCSRSRRERQERISVVFAEFLRPFLTIMGQYKTGCLEAVTCLSVIPFLPSDFICGSSPPPGQSFTFQVLILALAVKCPPRGRNVQGAMARMVTSSNVALLNLGKLILIDR